MNFNVVSSRSKADIIGFIWQHVLLIISLFIMTFGVALCVKSALGSSVISTIPFVLTLAGQESCIPVLSIGQWTYVMNFILVGLQIIFLRSNFQLVQLFQLLIGFFFGWLLDVNMYLSGFFPIFSISERILAQILGCSVLAFGITLEIRCGSITMPGEGLPVALGRVFNVPFAKMKILVDILLVIIAVALGYVFFGSWVWQVVGPGTLFAMIYVGALVKLLSRHVAWFDRLLCYKPGFRRYVYGLARFLFKN